MSVSEPGLPAKLADLPDTPPKSSDTEDLNLTLDCTT